ncbi:MAG: DUF2868 domain-containing protein [Gloeobacteraceae cyanobacterium ES-bin-144]|nr:DUF2868 domain-containing protein [Verrucomicrobiales bacterium]
MTHSSKRWTLEDLVDFEQVLTTSPLISPEARSAALAASRGLTGAAARRSGLRGWMMETDRTHGGRKFSAALLIVGLGLALVMLLAGISATVGMLDRERGGINVSLFIAILIGGQWLILILGALAWLVRRRAADGFSIVQALAGKIARHLAGRRDDTWWNRLMDGGGAPRAAVLWRLARMAQAAGIFFNLGILCALSGLVLIKHVGFFWETTTELAMQSLLENCVKFFSAPWSSWWPGAVPDASIIDSSRWLPGRTTGLAPGPSAWWEFLLMTTLVWGLLPRAILWIIAWHAYRQSLDKLDFQSRSHRALWREIIGTDRLETDEKPLDGVLVLDVGGGGLTESSLRPFLLRRLRVHPAAWQSIAVLDSGAEEEAARALAQAPAGVVLLAEGWSLSPARMIALHAKVRTSAGLDTPIKFLVANVGPETEPGVVTDEERREWTRFVDSLRDPMAEIFFYEKAQAFL